MPGLLRKSPQDEAASKGGETSVQGSPDSSPELVDPKQAQGIQGYIQPPPLTGLPVQAQQPGVMAIPQEILDQLKPAAGPVNKIKAGIQNEADAAAKLELQNAETAGTIADIYQDNAKKMAASNDAAMGNLSNEINFLKNLRENIQTRKIDPDRIWKDKTTAQKVTAGLALFLGSFGNSARGNGGVRAIQRAIDRDIALQKADIENEMKVNQLKADTSIYQALLQQFKSQETADQALLVTSLQGVVSRGQEMVGKFKSASQRAQGMQKIGQLELALDQEVNKLRASILGNALKDRSKKADDLNKVSVTIDGQNYYARSEAAAKEVWKIQSEVNPAINLLNQIITKAENNTRFNFAEERDLETLLNIFKTTNIKAFMGGGQVNDSERELMDAIIQDPSGFFKRREVAIQSLKTIKGAMNKQFLDKAAPYLQLDPNVESRFPSAIKRGE